MHSLLYENKLASLVQVSGHFKLSVYTYRSGIKQGSATYALQAEFSPSFILKIKFYWNAGTLICLQTISACFHAATAELSSCNTDSRAHMV